MTVISPYHSVYVSVVWHLYSFLYNIYTVTLFIAHYSSLVIIYLLLCTNADITALLDLCSTMKCKPHQHCVHYTGHSLDTHMAYCNDTCEGYVYLSSCCFSTVVTSCNSGECRFMGCKDHEECYVIQSGFCYRGPDLDRHCPYVAGCKLKCKYINLIIAFGICCRMLTYFSK